ncbi:MobP2 family relaxase [Pseudobacillus badius]|uniref:MobP2 family relaxase n=1 Tax=Bacillus badius TaxID=1455 RepID=UPI0005979068|nr:MobP2 family relaxase [Bacillus badius]KIL73866.1 hypothetical protein SD78_2924 [Bacillus badius]UAT32945.1 relaxase MobL [Bacillus badius]GLY11964.1 hypothetical protein Bbad01_31800 [Bacillus badius]
MSRSPGVVLKSKFVMPSASEYNNYVEYMDRDDVKREVQVNRHSQAVNDFQVYHSYINYMGDEEKQGSLFTSDIDELNSKQKRELKKIFHLAQQNGSPLWQDVISFDNQWLQKQALYDSKTGALDEEKIRNVVREAIKEMLKAENMEDTAVWSAAIHYNTDNIHVHVATVEPFPTREKKRIFDKETNEWTEQYRAKRKQGTLDKMKSRVANTILDRTKERNRINDLIRGSVSTKKSVDLATYRKTKRLFQKAIKKLPEDRKKWQYGYQAINDARPYIDEIVEVYLNTYHKKEMRELHKLLDDEVKVMKELYGEGSQYQKYKETKLNDLQKRLGNAVLVEIRAYDKRVRQMEAQTFYAKNHRSYTQYKWRRSQSLDSAIRNLQFRLRKSFHDYQKDRNVEEFDRMLDGYER